MTLPFEQAFQRLEQILEVMNGGKAPLEESLRLFEEAEVLLRTCSGKLTEAEQKIELLIKQRTGDLALDGDRPKTEPFLKGQPYL